MAVLLFNHSKLCAHHIRCNYRSFCCNTIMHAWAGARGAVSPTPLLPSILVCFSITSIAALLVSRSKILHTMLWRGDRGAVSPPCLVMCWLQQLC